MLSGTDHSSSPPSTAHGDDVSASELKEGIAAALASTTADDDALAMSISRSAIWKPSPPLAFVVLLGPPPTTDSSLFAVRRRLAAESEL